MILFNFKTSFRATLIITGMIKVGYILMVLGSVFFTELNQQYKDNSKLFYKYVCTFTAGMVIPSILYFKISRILMISLTELLFSLLMIIIPFTDNDLKVYGFLIAGGITFLLYPIYMKEHFLNAFILNLMIYLWFFIGVGVLYYLCLNNINYKIINSTPLIQTDDITPYIFGSISILNLILISISKQSDSICFYQQKGNTEASYQLISKIYQQQYIQKYSLQMRNIEQNIDSENLLDNASVTSIDEIEHKQDKNQINQQLIFAFFTGFSNIFFLIESRIFSYLLLMNGNKLNTEIESYQYFLYVLIILFSLVIGCLLVKHKIRKVAVLLSYFLSLIMYGIKLYSTEDNISSNSFNFFDVFQVVCLFGVVAPLVFALPFKYFKTHQIFGYFILFWFGYFSSKLFMQQSYKQEIDSNEIKKRYNYYIFPTIGNAIGVFSLLFVKNI